MTRTAFDKQLHDLHNDVLELGSMVEKALDRSMGALKNRDQEIAARVREDDLHINAKRFEIEEQCILIIATQAPVAADLRTIVAVLNIIVDLERMGDHAEGNAKIVQMMGDEPLVKPLVDLPNMARIANEMLRDSLNAFLDLDVDQARRVMERDDEVDQLQAQVYNELLTIMLADPRAIHGATYLLWTSHNIERIADRVTNICERVIFAKTGEMKEAGAIKAGR